MSTTTILSRKGTSTILGTLIFVSIIFSAFIPMMLVMRQADTIHEIRKHQLTSLDEEQYREDISYYAYPLDLSSNQIFVKIENKGSALVKIVSVWINDVVESPQDANIQSMATMELGPFTVDPAVLTSYTVKVVTEKGNIFTSLSGTLHSSGGTWYTPSLGICIHIESERGKYQIVSKEGGLEFYRYESDNTEQGDIEEIIWVDTPGTYYLTIKKWYPGDEDNWVVIPPYNNKDIIVSWPASKPITDVYVSGILE